MRSRTGCITCRQRKLKCDEVKPVCGHCAKGSRECIASEGVVFRHQQNASMNGEETDVGTPDGGNSNGRLGSFYSYKNTFDQEAVWVDVPRKVTFVNITDPLNMPLEPTPSPLPAHSPSLSQTAAHTASPAQTIRHIETRTPQNDASGLEALSEAAVGSHQLMQRSPLAESSIRSGVPSPFTNNLNSILNHPGSLSSPSVDPDLEAVSSHRSPEAISVSHRSSVVAPTPRRSESYEADTTHLNTDYVKEHEVAFLLRHFSETTGQWMDLFDRDCFFAHYCPVVALTNPLLMNAACAYAAKQISRVQGRKAVLGGLVGRQANMESFPSTVDWAYRGATYYDRAISLLMEALSYSTAPSGVVLGPNQDAINEMFISNAPPTPAASDRPISRQAGAMSPFVPGAESPSKRRRLSRPGANADETIAAAAILSVYEFLDNANSAWVRHLSGTKALFDLADRDVMIPRIAPSIARKATFWNFARQDFLSAFINECQTRLNTDDISLWKAAGLKLDEKGFVLPSTTDVYANDYANSESGGAMREDMRSNALIWLLSKLINYIASGDSIDHVFPQDRASPAAFIGINQMTLLERWKELEKELDVWYRGLPDTFRPCARLDVLDDKRDGGGGGSGTVSPAVEAPGPLESSDEGNNNKPRTVFPEIWYSNPMCAATMQTYHMARIILLVNRPHESTAKRVTVGDRLNSYRNIAAGVRYHSYQICGISLGRPDAAIRVHAVQPLFVAGQCLTERGEQEVVLELLRGIEKDLGWATDYRCRQLLREWEWDGEGGGKSRSVSLAR